MTTELKESTVDLDGNALCVMPKGFINLQETPAFFVTLSNDEIKEWKQFVKGKK